jgi:hypothetical protein
MANEFIAEDKIKNLSVAECLRLRDEYRKQLSAFYQTNPAILSRLLQQLNERLFEEQYHANHVAVYDAHEG